VSHGCDVLQRLIDVLADTGKGFPTLILDRNLQFSTLKRESEEPLAGETTTDGANPSRRRSSIPFAPADTLILPFTIRSIMVSAEDGKGASGA
jgi:hypothetical protein